MAYVQKGVEFQLDLLLLVRYFVRDFNILIRTKCLEYQNKLNKTLMFTIVHILCTWRNSRKI